MTTSLRISPYRLRLYGLGLLCAGLALALVLVLGRWLRARPAASPAPHARPVAHTDVNPYGANFFLTREVEPWKLEKTLAMAKEAGLGWVKQQFPWEEIEPERKGEYQDPVSRASSWAKFDQIVQACEAQGLQIVARLDRPPDWTRRDNAYQEAPPDDLQDYGDYVFAFVQRYAGRVRYIQIWNEPNIFPEWGNQPVDPGALRRDARDRLHACQAGRPRRAGAVRAAGHHAGPGASRSGRVDRDE